ncbi:MAG: hypothetical protein ACTSX6_03860 [Candidatus Heimdallarchaeaceae archaeon]
MKVQGYDRDLIVSIKRNYPELASETFPLAKEIQKRGVKVILTNVSWPRDTFYFHKDETFTEVNSRNQGQINDCPHFAWHGGTYLLGTEFVIGSDSILPKSKREYTHRELRVKRGIYLDVREISRDFDGVAVSGNKDFFLDVEHIDPFFNIANRKRKLFTYDTPRSIAAGRRLETETGYELIVLPKDDAEVAGIGFIELGDHMAVDKRARATIKVLETLGYKIIETPVPLVTVNKRHGSLRCITLEIPKVVHRMKFYSFIGPGVNNQAVYSHFEDLEGHRAIGYTSHYRRLREPLFPKELYP